MSAEPSFRVVYLLPESDPDVIDQAIAFFKSNATERLQTNSEQIRQKIASPKKGEDTFYFAALYRDATLIGFAMFGHYPGSKVAVIDHLIIKPGERRNGAYVKFAAGLSEKILKLAVNYVAVEIDLESDEPTKIVFAQCNRQDGEIRSGSSKVQHSCNENAGHSRPTQWRSTAEKHAQ